MGAQGHMCVRCTWGARGAHTLSQKMRGEGRPHRARLDAAVFGSACKRTSTLKGPHMDPAGVQARQGRPLGGQAVPLPAAAVGGGPSRMAAAASE